MDALQIVQVGTVAGLNQEGLDALNTAFPESNPYTQMLEMWKTMDDDTKLLILTRCKANLESIHTAVEAMENELNADDTTQ